MRHGIWTLFDLCWFQKGITHSNTHTSTLRSTFLWPGIKPRSPLLNDALKLGRQTLAWIPSVLRWPGIEPGSTAWKAAMLTTIPPTHECCKVCTCLQRGMVTEKKSKAQKYSETHRFWNLYEKWHLTVFWPLLVSYDRGPINSHMSMLSSFLHWPGIEPGSTAWEAAMLTTIPPMRAKSCLKSWMQLCNLSGRCKCLDT